MTALTGDFGLVAARVRTRLTAIFVASSATAPNVCALFVVRFFHQLPQFRAIGGAKP
jgi:hypothetical protein